MVILSTWFPILPWSLNTLFLPKWSCETCQVMRLHHLNHPAEYHLTWNETSFQWSYMICSLVTSLPFYLLLSPLFLPLQPYCLPDFSLNLAGTLLLLELCTCDFLNLQNLPVIFSAHFLTSFRFWLKNHLQPMSPLQKWHPTPHNTFCTASFFSITWVIIWHPYIYV